MAKLTKLPGLKVIAGFKGTIDFYLWKGIACVRKWPRSPGHFRAPAVMAKWAAFTWAATNWNSLSAEVQDAYKLMASGTNMTGRDLFMKGFLTPVYLDLD